MATVETTVKFGFPLLYESQSQKSVVVNGNMITLDALLHLTVVSRALTAPPASPANQDCYIVASTATGDWAGQDKTVAVWDAAATAWIFLTPGEGWLAWAQNDSKLVVYSSSSWQVLAGL